MESLPSRSQMLSSASPPCWRRQCRPRVGSRVVVRTSGGREHQWGREVDENMIVLRLRIREIKMMEKKKYEEEDCGMMRWEREYYEGEYGEHICEALGLLQSYLMTVRPCLAAGIVLLVALSVSISSGLLLFNSIDTMKALFTFIF
ncbi:hypothetical protein K1719_032475 [Acacia pycnantha]|nr:hypothetical protein K1719_032475 [Acacia pycnantha]